MYDCLVWSGRYVAPMFRSWTLREYNTMLYITDSVQEHYASNVCLIIVVDYRVILQLRLGFKMFNGEVGCLAIRILK